MASYFTFYDHRIILVSRVYIIEQWITICVVVKSKFAIEKGNEYTKKCRDSGQNDDLYADNQALCSCKSCLKYDLLLRVTFWRNQRNSQCILHQLNMDCGST